MKSFKDISEKTRRPSDVKDDVMKDVEKKLKGIKGLSTIDSISPDGKTVLATAHNSNKRLFAADIKKLAAMSNLKSISFDGDIIYFQLK